MTDAAPARDERIRVALVAPSLRYIGGQSAQAELLLRLWTNDPDVDVRFIAVDPAFPSVLSWVERIPVIRTIIREPLYCWNLWRGLRGVQVAHLFAASYWSFLLAPAPAAYLARWRGAKVLIHYHSGEARDHLRRFRSARHVLSRADRVVVPSGYLYDLFREFGLAATRVPNVVDLSQFRFRPRDPVRPNLVCTRGFSAYYCLDIVVRAYAHVQKAYPEAQLVLVGGGPLEAGIRKLVADLALSGVTFTGPASRTEIAGHYDRADIFVNASRLDNMPVSIIEAFASGTPVVTTSPECMPYMVDHGRTGLLSAVGDDNALAANVIRVLREPALAATLAQQALEEARRYAWGSVRAQWRKLYRELVQTSLRRPVSEQPGPQPQERVLDQAERHHRARSRGNDHQGE
jgi:glycosyltransferase involved in cell wall biosynthesis